MTGELWFALYCAAAVLFLLMAVAFALVVSRSGAYVTLDCRDGVHGGCQSCDCDCHGLVLA